MVQRLQVPQPAEADEAAGEPRRARWMSARAVGMSAERVAKGLARGRQLFLKLHFHLYEYLNERIRLTAASGAELGERPTASLVNLGQAWTDDLLLTHFTFESAKRRFLALGGGESGAFFESGAAFADPAQAKNPSRSHVDCFTVPLHGLQDCMAARICPPVATPPGESAPGVDS